MLCFLDWGRGGRLYGLGAIKDGASIFWVGLIILYLGSVGGWWGLRAVQNRTCVWSIIGGLWRFSDGGSSLGGRVFGRRCSVVRCGVVRQIWSWVFDGFVVSDGISRLIVDEGAALGEGLRVSSRDEPWKEFEAASVPG